MDGFDIAVIGYGPVGMATAALLGASGHRVVVLERYSGKYNLPRAAIFDDETMRTFARIGIAERMLPRIHAQRRYEWRNADGALLIEHDFAEFGRSGWAEWYMMYQPDLEDALDDVCQSLPTVDVRFDSNVTAIAQTADDVTMTMGADGKTVTARYVIACDGGNSFVRRALAIPMDDYGFSEPWMVCDFRLKPGVVLPMALQVCNPAQPISIISLGPDHHRFSFMLGADEDPDVAGQADNVWRRVAAYLKPDQGELIRAATYTFRSLVAQHWRERRILLAGDAAHQMPPFLGQGMCSGVRDSINLSLKFDLVLTQGRSEALLDTYQTERDDHVRAVIQKGIELGRVQTMRDPVSAAARDLKLIAEHQARAKPQKIVFPPLGSGLFGGGQGAHELFVQGFVSQNGQRGRFDELVGYGNVIVVRAGQTGAISSATIAAAKEASIRIVGLAATDTLDAVVPQDSIYEDWFAQHDCEIAAIRSDFHVWGTARAGAGDALILAFIAELTSASVTIAQMATVA